MSTKFFVFGKFYLSNFIFLCSIPFSVWLRYETLKWLCYIWNTLYLSLHRQNPDQWEKEIAALRASILKWWQMYEKKHWMTCWWPQFVNLSLWAVFDNAYKVNLPFTGWQEWKTYLFVFIFKQECSDCITGKFLFLF